LLLHRQPKSRPGGVLPVVTRSKRALDQASSVAQKTLPAKLCGELIRSLPFQLTDLVIRQTIRCLGGGTYDRTYRTK
jgi:hypothetical protein